MNWNLILWFAGIMATLAGLKFVIVFFKSLFSRDMMEDVIDGMGNKISKANKKLTEKIKKKAIERKQKKEEEKEKKQEEWKPTVEPRRLYY